jgi:hypothetical protein
MGFLGSCQWTSEQTADGLALAQMFGPPSLFITMMCNPDWPEIKCRLRKGQKANDIPIIVARAFKVRVQRLISILKTRFGNLVYIIKIIEFQKRGLPHIHIVIKVRRRPSFLPSSEYSPRWILSYLLKRSTGSLVPVCLWTTCALRQRFGSI